jgi:hypothetical protein
MLQTRKQIDKSIKWVFGPYERDAQTERAQIAGPDESGSFIRDLPFLLALVTVLIVGAAIVVW